MNIEIDKVATEINEFVQKHLIVSLTILMDKYNGAAPTDLSEAIQKAINKGEMKQVYYFTAEPMRFYDMPTLISREKLDSFPDANIEVFFIAT